MKWISLILTCSLLGLSSCTSAFKRSDASGYGTSDETSTVKAYYQDRADYNREETKQELGLNSSYPLSENDARLVEDRLALKRLEARLQTNREKRQYYKHKGNMQNDRERASFLKIPTVEARERWLETKGYTSTPGGYSDDIANLIEANDIALGMPQKAVTESWGDPDLIEVSGNPVYGNERWKYTRYVSGGEGYSKELRFVYFEAGRVVGWESF